MYTHTPDPSKQYAIFDSAKSAGHVTRVFRSPRANTLGTRLHWIKIQDGGCFLRQFRKPSKRIWVILPLN
jgi:hypothetical protein